MRLARPSAVLRPAARAPSVPRSALSLTPRALRPPRIRGLSIAHYSTVRSLYRITPEADLERLDCTPDQLLAIIPGLSAYDLHHGIGALSEVVLTTSVQDNKRQIASIIVRGSAVIINVELVRAIVTPQAAVLLDADKLETQDFLKSLKRSLTEGKMREDLEMLVLDIAMRAATEEYEDRTRLLSLLSTKALSAFDEHQSDMDDALLRFLPLRRSLLGVRTSLKEFRSAVAEVAHSSERLYLCRVTHRFVRGGPLPIGAYNETKFMFEEYVKRMEALENEIEELGDRLASSTKLIATSLDVTQNAIMHMNLHVSMAAAVASFAGAMAAVWGMNVYSGYETSREMFAYVLYGIGGSSMVMLLLWGKAYSNTLNNIKQIGRRVFANRTFENVNSLQWRREIAKRTDAHTFVSLLSDLLGRKVDMGEALEIFMVNDENDDGLLTPVELETAISHFLRKVQSER